jgi:hypothetical protein
VTSRVMTDEGFDDAGGAPVFVDGKRAGTTPAKIDTKPGLHSIKVGGLQPFCISLRHRREARRQALHTRRIRWGEPIVIDCSKRGPRRRAHGVCLPRE